MGNKCDGCIFRQDFRDMGSSTPVCLRSEERDLLADIEACKTPGPCPWHITLDTVRQLQGQSSQAPGLSPLDAEKIFAKIQASEEASASLSTAFVELGEAAKAAIKPLRRAIEALGEALR